MLGIIGVATLKTVPCLTGDGSIGTLDCGGRCLSAANCSLAAASYSQCKDWSTDVTCDKGDFRSDDGSRPNWNCPAYACDMNACASCGVDPPFGVCGVSYTCGANGRCGQSGLCVCDAGFLGFTCEYGRGVCPNQFDCGGGICVAGVCECPAGFSGHDCSVALSTQLPHSELVALTELFHATGGDAWHENKGWLTATDPCEGGPKGRVNGYYGVICDEEGHVEELWLASNKLRNTLPRSLVKLSRLNYLNVAGNSLEGFLDNALSELLRHTDMRVSLINNAFYCPLPVSLRPLVGSCVDASLVLHNVTPAEAFAFSAITVTIHAELRGGAATLAEYPELRVRLTKDDGDVLYLPVDGASGDNALRVVLPGSDGGMTAQLALMHASEVIASGEVEFSYLECAAGEYKGVDDATLAVRCEVCPRNSFCVNNRRTDCPAGMHTAGTGASDCESDSGTSGPTAIIVLSTVIAVSALVGGVVAAKRFRQHYMMAVQAQRDRHLALQVRLQEAAVSVTSLKFGVCLVRFSAFKQHGKLISHEEARQLGDIITLDLYEHVLAFGEKYPTIFISHQWLGFSEPDPDRVHYNAIIECVISLCESRSFVPDEVFLWVDYISIPQRNHNLQTLSISSLSVYSSFPKFFVIVAPLCTHHDTKAKCDKDSYRSRAWTRLEQWARMTRFDTEDMYLFDGSRDDNGLAKLSPVAGDRPWYQESIKVLDGEFSHAADRERMVDTIIGLWCQAVKYRKSSGSTMTFYELVMADKDAVFPQKYFGDLITTLEEPSTLLSVLSQCSPAPKHLPPLPADVLATLSGLENETEKTTSSGHSLVSHVERLVSDKEMPDISELLIWGQRTSKEKIRRALSISSPKSRGSETSSRRGSEKQTSSRRGSDKAPSRRASRMQKRQDSFADELKRRENMRRSNSVPIEGVEVCDSGAVQSGTAKLARTGTRSLKLGKFVRRSSL